MPNMCHMCKRQEESALHLFHTCAYTRQIIVKARSQNDVFGNTVGRRNNIYDDILLESKNTKQKMIQPTICFVIWRERCRRIFQGVQKTPNILLMKIRNELRSWFSGQEMMNQAQKTNLSKEKRGCKLLKQYLSLSISILSSHFILISFISFPLFLLFNSLELNFCTIDTSCV